MIKPATRRPRKGNAIPAAPSAMRAYPPMNSCDLIDSIPVSKRLAINPIKLRAAPRILVMSSPTDGPDTCALSLNSLGAIVHWK